jgi:hypothetical protein
LPPAINLSKTEMSTYRLIQIPTPTSTKTIAEEIVIISGALYSMYLMVVQIQIPTSNVLVAIS